MCVGCSDSVGNVCKDEKEEDNNGTGDSISS